MSNNWFAVYSNYRDYHQQKGEVNYLRYAFEDTAVRMSMDEKTSLKLAKEKLNGMVPMWNAQKTKEMN